MSNKKIESLNRAVQTAADLFAEKPFDEVQIADIAARAHCSTATIYEAFETKKGLFQAALRHKSGRDWPVLKRASAPNTLFPLMSFLSSRITRLSTPAMNNFWRSVSSDTKHVEQVMQQSLLDTDQLGAIIEQVELCMNEGRIRSGEPGAVAYLLMAGTGYEPVVYGLLYGRQAACPTAAILEAVLSPLVTELGRQELSAFVAGLKGGDRSGEAMRPSLLGYLQDAARTWRRSRWGGPPAASTQNFDARRRRAGR